MSLEDVLAKNTEALLGLAEVIRKSDALRTELLNRSDDVLAAAQQGKATKAKAETKTEAKAEAAPAPAAEPAATPSATEKPSVPAAESAAIKATKEKATQFFSAASSTEDREKRRNDLAELLKKLNAERISDLSDADALRLGAALDKLTERYAAAPPSDDLLG